MEERTAEILKRFRESWDLTQARFDDLVKNHNGFERLIPLQQFIAKLRSEGYDRYFRVGTSISDLLLSRSVDFGLRIDQKYIRIEVIDATKIEVALRDGEKIYRRYIITTLNDEKLTNLLITLKSTMVD